MTSAVEDFVLFILTVMMPDNFKFEFKTAVGIAEESWGQRKHLLLPCRWDPGSGSGT